MGILKRNKFSNTWDMVRMTSFLPDGFLRTREQLQAHERIYSAAHMAASRAFDAGLKPEDAVLFGRTYLVSMLETKFPGQVTASELPSGLEDICTRLTHLYGSERIEQLRALIDPLAQKVAGRPARSPSPQEPTLQDKDDALEAFLTASPEGFVWPTGRAVSEEEKPLFVAFLAWTQASAEGFGLSVPPSQEDIEIAGSGDEKRRVAAAATMFDRALTRSGFLPQDLPRNPNIIQNGRFSIGIGTRTVRAADGQRHLQYAICAFHMEKKTIWVVPLDYERNDLWSAAVRAN